MLSKFDAGWRQCEGIEDMNNKLLDAINSTVDVRDTLWLLGDFAFCGVEDMRALRKKIRCRQIFFIYGNHDRYIMNSGPLRKDLFAQCYHYKEVKFNGVRFCLFHYPIDCWNSHNNGSIHLHGHCHGSLPKSTRKIEDVGVDCHHFPLAIDEIFDIMSHRTIEHHDKITGVSNFGKEQHGN